MSRFFINRPIVAMVISIVMVIIGAITILTLPVALFPNIVPPKVQVLANFASSRNFSPPPLRVLRAFPIFATKVEWPATSRFSPTKPITSPPNLILRKPRPTNFSLSFSFTKPSAAAGNNSQLPQKQFTSRVLAVESSRHIILVNAILPRVVHTPHLRQSSRPRRTSSSVALSPNSSSLITGGHD
jgi:AcrB/AcrD/AcrF family